jgi:hypothetical protein
MTVALTQANVTPLAQAHAHNDYLHRRPLFDALAHGFTSVEADVFLVGDQLCVAHDAREIRPERTLGSLYLDPLRERARQNGGRIYPGRMRFLLLIDLKSAAEPTYRRLHETLAEYRDLVTSFGPEGRQDKAVLVVVSGNRPFELMRSQETRYAGCDGRLTDLYSMRPPTWSPLISDRWLSILRGGLRCRSRCGWQKLEILFRPPTKRPAGAVLGDAGGAFARADALWRQLQRRVALLTRTIWRVAGFPLAQNVTVSSRRRI